MAIIDKNSEHMNRLHDTLPGALGGAASDYRVTGIGNNITIELINPVTTEELLTEYLAKWNSLTLANDKPGGIAADGIEEAVITCPGETHFDAYLWGGNIILQTWAGIADGSIEFSTDTPGTYVIEIRKANGESGYVEVTANES